MVEEVLKVSWVHCISKLDTDDNCKFCNITNSSSLSNPLTGKKDKIGIFVVDSLDVYKNHP